MQFSVPFGVVGGVGALDEPVEVCAQPRHAGELGAVRQFVERDPPAEVEGAEAEALLERQDVDPDVIDHVAGGFVGVAGDGRLVEEQQVVLAEHTLAHVAEQHPYLATGCGPAKRRQRGDRNARTEFLRG